MYLDALAQEFFKYYGAEISKTIESTAKELTYKAAWEELRKAVEENF